MRFEGVKLKNQNACNYVIQKSSIVILPNIDLINIRVKIDKLFLCKYLELRSKTMFNLYYGNYRVNTEKFNVMFLLFCHIQIKIW